MAKGEVVRRIGWALALLPISGGGGYFVRELFRYWGILDPLAASLGGALKMNVPPALFWNAAGLMATMLLWSGAIFLIARRRHSAPSQLPTIPRIDSDYDNQITLEMQWLSSSTIPMPPEGVIQELFLTLAPETMILGGPNAFHQRAPSVRDFAATFPDATLYPSVRCCQITNYTDGPIFDCVITFHVWFVNSFVDDAHTVQTTAGKSGFRRPWEVRIPRIEAGAPNKFYFYIYSWVEDNIVVTVPRTITFKRLGNEIKLTSTLLLPGKMGEDGDFMITSPMKIPTKAPQPEPET